MDELLLLIARHAGLGTLKTSTGRISRERGVSQQTVSRWLRELENNGIIARVASPGGVTVCLTEKGIDMLKEEYKVLETVFGGSNRMVGAITTGFGEGSYYVKQYSKKLEALLGFKPYAGTLNCRVNVEKKKTFIACSDRLVIEGFSSKHRAFGAVMCYPAAVFSGNNERRKFIAALLAPARARHEEEIAEIVAAVNLRRALRLKDNDKIIIERR